MKTEFSAIAFVTVALLACQVQAADFLADRHAKLGVPCEACHGPDKNQPAEPTLETCTKCHALPALTEKTGSMKPNNPHISPHYQDQLDFINCHLGHQAVRISAINVTASASKYRNAFRCLI